MREFEIRRWLIETAEKDLWWLSVNGEVYEAEYTLSEADEFAKDLTEERVLIQHVSGKAIYGDSKWIELESAAPLRRHYGEPNRSGAMQDPKQNEWHRMKWIVFPVGIITIMISAFFIFRTTREISSTSEKVERVNLMRTNEYLRKNLKISQETISNNESQIRDLKDRIEIIEKRSEVSQKKIKSKFDRIFTTASGLSYLSFPFSEEEIIDNLAFIRGNYGALMYLLREFKATLEKGP